MASLRENSHQPGLPVPANPAGSGPLPFLFSSFARNLSTSLSAQLRRDYELQFQSMRRCRFSEVRRLFQNPACLAVFKIEPSGAPLIIEIGPEFAKGIVELLLGGHTEEQPDETGAALTAIEQHLLVDILHLIAAELKLALNKIAPFAFHLEQIETAPEMVRVLSGRDLIDVIAFEVQNEDSVWPMRFYQPAAIADGLSSDAPDASADDDDGANAGILSVIGSAEIDFEARLSRSQVPLSDLGSLEPGDILHLSFSTGHQVVATINGVEHFRGQIVGANRRRAFRVEG